MMKNDQRLLAIFTNTKPVIFIDSNPCCATLICSWLSKSSKMMNGLPYVDQARLQERLEQQPFDLVHKMIEETSKFYKNF